MVVLIAYSTYSIVAEWVGDSVQFSHSIMSSSLWHHWCVHHQLLKLAQTHIHWVGDAIQPCHPLSSPSPTFSLSQHQGLFKWISSSNQVAKVLEFRLQHQSFQWIFRTLGWTGWISLQSKGLSKVFSNTSSKALILWRSAFFIEHSQIYTRLLETP